MGMLEEQMQRYGLKTGSERTDTVEYKLFNKAEVVHEVTSKGIYSAFHDFRDQVSVSSSRGVDTSARCAF